MAFNDASFPVSAKMTNTARDIIARSGIKKLAFKIQGFSVGTGGYDNANPVQTLPIDQNQTALANQVSPATGYSAFQSIESIESVRIFNCRLPATLTGSDADYGLGEIGLWAEVIESDHTEYPVGTQYLYAIAHMPIRAKTHKDVFLFRVVVNY